MSNFIKLKLLNIKFILFFSFFIFSSCSRGPTGAGLSANVFVRVVSSGSGDKVRAQRPVIFLSGGSKVCRPRPYRIRDARRLLIDKGLTRDFLDDFFYGSEEVAEESRGEEDDRFSGVSNNDPVRIDVGDNWLKFGLQIANNNSGANSFFLVVENLSYSALAIYKGQAFQHAGNIDSGYCSDDDGRTPPYLYLVPPQNQANYLPHGGNPFDNLTIFLDGFDIIDRSNELSLEQQKRLQRTENSDFLPPLDFFTEDRISSERDIIVIPEYNVELTLRGYFMTKSGDNYQTATFVKRVSFRTLSSLELF